jgi:hypothetical protein
MSDTPDISQLSDAQLQALYSQQQGSSDGSSDSTSSGNSASSGMSPLAAINQIESSGASDTAAVANPASTAQGSMQVLAGTRSDPGYGVTPSNGTAQDNARVGRDYYNALQNKYGDPQTAALAYSWGPGNVDKWMKNGADLSALPNTQLQYLNKFQTLTGAQDPSASTQNNTPAVPRITGSPTIDGAIQGVKNVASNIGNGISQAVQHPIDAATGAAAGIWNPLTNGLSGATVAEASQAPNNGINVTPQTIAAQQAVSQSHNITPGAGTNTTAFNAGKTASQMAAAAGVGAFVPEIPAAEGAGLLGRMGVSAANNAVQGGVQSGVVSQLNGDSLADTGKNMLYGTLGGAAMGPVATGVGAVAKPIIAAATGVGKKLAGIDAEVANAGLATGGALSPAEQAMAAKVNQAVEASGTGQTAQTVANDLSSNANSAVPGYQRTAAEATQNPTIQALQKGLDNSTDNSALVARNDANANANSDFITNGAPTDASIQAQKDSFQQSQDALAQQGNQEVGTVSPQDDTSTFNTPAMQRNLSRANTVAQNDGSQAIQQAFDQPNNDAVASWNSVAGSPQKTANLELLRQTTTSPQYDDVLNAAQPIPVDGEMQQLLRTPAMQKVQRAVETYKLNAGDSTPFVQDVPATGAQGEQYAQSISPQDLNLAKMHLDDYIQRMGNPSDIASADKFERGNYIGMRSRINDTLENQVPGFANVNKQYAQLSDQMEESKFLTSPTMVDAFNKMNIREQDALIKRIQSGKANNNDFDTAKTISNAKLAQMMQAHSDLVAAQGRVAAAGLNGDSFNYLRQAQKDPVAAQQLQQYLTGKSPAYQQFYSDATAGDQAINQAQNHLNLVNKMGTRPNGNVTWNDVKNLNTASGDYEPFTAAKLNAVQDNLQRFANRAEQVTGSPTASNIAKRQGYEDFIQAQPGKTFGNFLMSENGQRLGRLGVDAGAYAVGLNLHGVEGLLGGLGLDTLGSVVAKGAGRLAGGETPEMLATKTAANRQALEGLLMNPQRLSHAMSAVSGGTAKTTDVMNGLLSRVAATEKGAGLLGALAAGQLAGNSNSGKRN